MEEAVGFLGVPLVAPVALLFVLLAVFILDCVLIKDNWPHPGIPVGCAIMLLVMLLLFDPNRAIGTHDRTILTILTSWECVMRMHQADFGKATNYYYLDSIGDK